MVRQSGCKRYSDLWTTTGTNAEAWNSITGNTIHPVTWAPEPEAAAATNGTMCFCPQTSAAAGQKRDGPCSRLKSLMFRLDGSAASTVDDIAARIVVILDKQANATAAVGTDVYEQTAKTGADKVNVNLLMENRFRFQTLLDKRITINNTNGVDSFTFTRKYFIKFAKPLEFQWDLTAGAAEYTVTAMRTNNIIMFIINNNSVWTLVGTCRARFWDDE